MVEQCWVVVLWWIVFGVGACRLEYGYLDFVYGKKC